MKETELLQVLQSLKPDKALRKLYQYYPTVKRFITKNGGSATEAEDIFQDAMVILVRNVQKPNFVATAALTTYLFSICKYAWKQELIKKNKANAYAMDESVAAVAKDWTENLEAQHRNANALKALQQLGQRCWSLLKGFYYEQQSMEQLAVRFGFKSKMIAKNEKYKCLEKARQNFSQLQTS